MFFNFFLRFFFYVFYVFTIFYVIFTFFYVVISNFLHIKAIRFLSLAKIKILLVRDEIERTLCFKHVSLSLSLCVCVSHEISGTARWIVLKFWLMLGAKYLRIATRPLFLIRASLSLKQLICAKIAI